MSNEPEKTNEPQPTLYNLENDIQLEYGRDNYIVYSNGDEEVYDNLQDAAERYSELTEE